MMVSLHLFPPPNALEDQRPKPCESSPEDEIRVESKEVVIVAVSPVLKIEDHGVLISEVKM